MAEERRRPRAPIVVAGERRPVHLSWEDRLIKHMLARYRARGKFGRPVRNYNDTMKVNFMIQLVQIMDLDEKNQVLTLNVWDRYTWNDIHMQWDPEKWGGVDQIRVPSEKLWIPDVRLYNYADSRLEEHRDALLVVSYNGSILWMPQAIYRSSCEIDVQGFPFDIQNCELKFGSWTYDGNKVDLNLLVNENHDPNKTDLSAYVNSNSWRIIDAPAMKRVQYYTCCPEPYVDLAFILVFQRRATFYNYILILPCILLTSITLVLFWIPPESPAKLMLGISIFVAFFLLLLLMESNLPPAATKVPLLGKHQERETPGRHQERETPRKGDTKKGRHQERETPRKGDTKKGRQQERETTRKGDTKKGRHQGDTKKGRHQERETPRKGDTRETPRKGDNKKGRHQERETPRKGDTRETPRKGDTNKGRHQERETPGRHQERETPIKGDTRETPRKGDTNKGRHQGDTKKGRHQERETPRKGDTKKGRHQERETPIKGDTKKGRHQGDTKKGRHQERETPRKGDTKKGRHQGDTKKGRHQGDTKKGRHQERETPRKGDTKKGRHQGDTKKGRHQ
ncbi:hypothetical protein ACOMHN_041879 [Nucella lapillus]